MRSMIDSNCWTSSGRRNLTSTARSIWSGPSCIVNSSPTPSTEGSLRNDLFDALILARFVLFSHQ